MITTFQPAHLYLPGQGITGDLIRLAKRVAGALQDQRRGGQPGQVVGARALGFARRMEEAPVRSLGTDLKLQLWMLLGVFVQMA